MATKMPNAASAAHKRTLRGHAQRRYGGGGDDRGSPCRAAESLYPQQRRGAARGLGECPEAAAALCFALETEAQKSVREAIFAALIRIGEPGAEGLLSLLHSDDAGLRNGAIEALKTMPAAMAAHVDEVLAGPADVRIFGVEILGALANPQSSRRLARVLAEDREINVCAAAVDARSP